MYNAETIDCLVQMIKDNDGIADKTRLASIIKTEFNLTRDRSVYFCDDFTIRFSKSERKKMSNTVLSLSALQKFDSKPFLVCVVSSSKNYLMLANSTFLKKISHSSQELRIDNIRGSFNGGDIFMELGEISNDPENFQELFDYHSGLSFEDNLERLVESTNNIVGRVQKFEITNTAKPILTKSIQRAKCFTESSKFHELKHDLDSRVANVQNEIAIAAFIDNVNIRGRIIEYLITDNGSSLKDQIIDALKNKKPLPTFKTEDRLGDYSKEFPEYNTETDIKTKVLFLDGNPKAYNIDKLLAFLSTEKSVYLVYLLGISDTGAVIARLCSVFDNRLVNATNVIHHWAGRNSRGVAQFIGTALCDILSNDQITSIDHTIASNFLNSLIDR